MSDEPIEDPVFEQQIEAEVTRAIGPYLDVYPPQMVEEAKRLLRFGLRHDPATRQRFRLLRPDPIVDESGKVGVGAFRESGPAKKSRNGGAA